MKKCIGVKLSDFRGKTNIGIITFPSSMHHVAVSNLVDVIYSVSKGVHLITGSAGYKFFAEKDVVPTYGVEHRATKSLFSRAANYVWTQLKMSRQLIKLRRQVDLWLFFIGGEGLVLPMIIAKLLRKGILIASAGSGLKVAQIQKDPLAKVLALLGSITYRLSDRIIIYSERLVDELGLQKHKNKISLAHEHFLDFGKFKKWKSFSERGELIGYIGTLNKAKGISNFLDAIPHILARKGVLEILIGGDGEMRTKIEQYVSERNLGNKVKLLGWIPHDRLPTYLNDLKLLVLPSYTEGLPNIMLEAMSCGTAVLATPVGAIPDVVKDSETGFIMEDSSPECIARNVIRALNHPNLGEITRNARALIEKEYTYEKAVEGYRNILEELL